MLSAETVTATLVSALQTIPDLIAVLNGDSECIIGHEFLYGVEQPLVKAIYEMMPTTILVAYEAQMSGNFNGQTVFKHRLALYMRSANMANQDSPTGLWNLWALILNGPVNGAPHNIREVFLIDGQLRSEERRVGKECRSRR